jgi:CDP-diacylglycerol--glycerol-3-phosphate 3-phosphatidyltransferase
MTMNPSTNREKQTFTDFLRKIFKGVLESIARFLNRLGITPMVVTAFGLIGNLVAGGLIAFGFLFWGGLLAMIIWPLDALDGTLARMRNESSKYGSFVDSITDRYSEIAIFLGLLLYFISEKSMINIVLVFLAVVGGLQVSYMRAKAESLNYSSKIGLLTRAERYIILMPGLLFNIPSVALWILAVLTHVTALQRFWNVRKQVNAEMSRDLLGGK